jgi:ABC-2 type transport system permease protein
VIAVFKRELGAYYRSMLAWMLTSMFLFISGLLFVLSVKYFADQSMMSMQSAFGGGPNVMDDLIAPTIRLFGFLLLFFLPLLTMRLFAEEKRSGTLDLLFTYPLTEAQIIGGKFLAALTVLGMMLAFTLADIIMLWRILGASGGRSGLEWPLIGMGYLGLLLLGGAFVAFGLWASSLTNSQVVAAAISYAGLILAWIAGGLGEMMEGVKERVGSLSFLEPLSNMTTGNLDVRDIVFYVAWIALWLFLTARVLESRKWSG